MTDSSDNPRPLRTFADDIQKHEKWLKKWLFIFSAFAALNVVIVVDSWLTSPAPHNQPAFIYMILSSVLAAYFAFQRHQLNKLKTKHFNVNGAGGVQLAGDEGLPHVRYTNGLIIRAISQGVTHIELSTARPLEPLSFDNGATWQQPVQLGEVVRRLKIMCGHKANSTTPEFFKIKWGNPVSQHIVTCTLRDTDDYASITITPDPDSLSPMLPRLW